MSAATDFVHDEEIVDAVIAQLANYLPAQWTRGDNPFLRLKRLQFGDLREYRLSPGESYRDLCPAIMVRLNRSESAVQYGGLGGKEGQVVPLRLVHVRTREQCRSLSNLEHVIPPPRARAQCAKVISKALFANRDLGNPTLTTDDTSARVVDVRPRAIIYDAQKGDVGLAAREDLVALAIDFEVVVRTQ